MWAATELDNLQHAYIAHCGPLPRGCLCDVLGSNLLVVEA
jgi:hypothetical protein